MSSVTLQKFNFELCKTLLLRIILFTNPTYFRQFEAQQVCILTQLITMS